MKRIEAIIDGYRLLCTALVLNVAVIYMILMLDVRYVDFTMLTGFYFSCVVLGYYVLPLLLITSTIFVLFFPLRRLALVSVCAAVTVFVSYLLIDYFVYRIAKIHIDLFWLEWILNDPEGFGIPPVTIRTALLVLFVIIAAEVGVFYIAGRIRKPRYFVLAFWLFTVLSFAVSQVIHAVAYENNVNQITSMTPHLPLYMPITSHKNVVKYEGLLPFDEANPADTHTEQQFISLSYPLSEMKYNVLPGKKLPNIVILFLESWRFDMMNEAVTPNIFALSKRSSVFLKHFSSGNSTVAGVFGLFYGLHPTYWTAVKANNVLIDNPVFIDILKDNKYTFGIYARSNFQRHKIKDAIFRGITAHESFAGKTSVEQDRDMTEQLLSFIREQHYNSNPYMAFAFYKSNHFPYKYPEEDSIYLPAEDINLMFADDNTDPVYYRNDYMNSTHYVDRLIGEVLDQIDSLGDMANTVIIITTDHSDELNDNRANYWGHGNNFTKYQTMVPLILYLPGREPRQIDYRTSHIDIVPTLLQEVFGCANDIRDYSNGRNLFEEQTELRPIVVGGYVNHAFIVGDNVYEIYPIYTKKYKLYDIKKDASQPSPNISKTIMEEINRFFDNNDINEHNVPVQNYVDKNKHPDTTAAQTVRSPSVHNDILVK